MGASASPEVLGRYAIYGRMASGGMASVHFGRLQGGGGFARTVAIKRLHPHLAQDPEFLSTMIDEARLAARVHHPNVVPMLDVVATGGELLLVMEYVRGEPLAWLLKHEMGRERVVPLPIASAIVIGALHGLHAAHEATSDLGEPLGLVHRDVSPHNILVGVDGVARVIDFGIAKAGGRLQTTGEGIVKGKVSYMSPEQLSGDHLTRASDVYAMGVVLWETLAGRRLFTGDNDASVMGHVLKGVREPPSHHVPGLPGRVDEIVMTALAPHPAGRFGTALEMADALLRAMPPAFPTDVGKWCQEAAYEPLAKRATLLAEIERFSGSDASSPSLVRDRSTSAPGSPTPFVEATEVNRSQAPTVRRAVLVGTISAATLTTLWLGVLWGRGTVSEAPGSAHALTVGASSLPEPPEAPSPPSRSDAPSPPPSASAPSGTSVVPNAPTLAAPRRVSHVPAARSQKDPAAGCNPEFYYDANGDKHFKPECFRR